MDKFYCRSGGMRVVLNAEGPAEAAEAALKKMLDAMRPRGGRGDGPGVSLVMSIGRTGYDDESPFVVATIPLARSIGSVLGSTPKEVAERYGIDLESMPPAGREWLFGE